MRDKLPLFPTKTCNILDTEQLPHLAERHKLIAYNILNTTLNVPIQQNYIAYLSEDTIFPVTQQLVWFLNNFDQYESYNRPSSELASQPESSEKSFALMQAIYEDEVLGMTLPYVHNKEKQREV
jgi:hypothetical protein